MQLPCSALVSDLDLMFPCRLCRGSQPAIACLPSLLFFVSGSGCLRPIHRLFSNKESGEKKPPTLLAVLLGANDGQVQNGSNDCLEWDIQLRNPYGSEFVVRQARQFDCSLCYDPIIGVLEALYIWKPGGVRDRRK